MHRAGGFTFLELILVLVLMGLVAGLVMPALGGVLDRTQRNAAAREIASAMRYARSQAVSAKTATAFVADFEMNRYWLENLGTEERSSVRFLPREIVFREFSSGDGQRADGTVSIVFFPRGNTSGGTLVLAPPQDRDHPIRFAIRVDPVTGRPEVSTYEE